MKKAFYIILLLLSFSLSPDASAISIWPHRKSAQTAEPAKPEKTPYQKFISRKGTLSCGTSMKLYRQDGKLYMEIPDTLFGSKLIINSIIRKSDDPSLVRGTDISGSFVCQLTHTDSLITFLATQASKVIETDDETIARSLNNSLMHAVLMACPIKYRHSDTTSVGIVTSYVIAADALFNLSDENVADLSGLPLGNDMLVYEPHYKKDLSVFKELVSFRHSVGIVTEATYDYSRALAMLGIASSGYKLSAEIMTTVTALPYESFDIRKADPRIGTRKMRYTYYTSTEGSRKLDRISRWNIKGDKKIDIYIDTLFTPSWQKAISDGIGEWNKAFEKAGLGQKIVIRKYPSDSTFHSDDPLISTVSMGDYSGESISARVMTDLSTGEIIKCAISVPGDYLNSVRKNSVSTISDVDTRYQKYDLPDDAVCEVLKAQVMSYFGLCLGMLRNYAGSNAYSPQQLRDPAFTQSHGITASVTDNVLFNYLARPGDKERGVVTISDRIGPYDYYAIDCIYSHGKDIDSLARAHDGDPEYFYCERAANNADPRGIADDLGNDPFAAYEAGISHIRFTMANADKWIDKDDIKQDYKDLFLDFIWLRMASVIRILSSQVGAVETNYMFDGSKEPKYSTVDKATQKKALKTVISGFMDAKWLDENKNLLHIAGANKNVTDLTVMNAFSQSLLKRRLELVAMAHQIAGSDYTPEEFMQDLQNELFVGVKGGKLKRGQDYMLSVYLSWLIGESSVLKRNYYEASGIDPKSDQISDAQKTNTTEVPSVYTSDLENVCYSAIMNARKLLTSAVGAASDEYTRGRLKYLLSMTIKAMEGKNYQ